MQGFRSRKRLLGVESQQDKGGRAGLGQGLVGFGKEFDFHSKLSGKTLKI